jgi:hypothetical protein
MPHKQRKQPSEQARRLAVKSRWDVPRVEPRTAYAMIKASRIAAISVGWPAPSGLDMVLSYIKEIHQGVVGWVDAHKIDLSDNSTRAWIDAQHGRLGHPAGPPVRHGYYLFLDGEACAYEAGLVDYGHDTMSLGVGLATALAALCCQSMYLAKAAPRCANLQATVRVLERFEAAIAARQQSTRPGAPHQAPPPPSSLAPDAATQEVQLAFATLGLPSAATHDEVKARFRALARQWHPDRLTNNAPKVPEASSRMSQINVAYSAICAARGW